MDLKIERLSLQIVDKWQDQIKNLMLEATLKSFPDNMPDDDYYDSSLSKIQKYLSEEKAVVFLATEEDLLLGFAWCHEIIRFQKRRLHISSLAVNPQNQYGGIGTSLMAEIRNYAEKNGFDGIDLLVTDSNDVAKRFYLKNGFDTERLLMSKDF